MFWSFRSVLLLFISMIKTPTKFNLGRKGLILSYISQVTAHNWGKPGQEPGAQVMKVCCLLTCCSGFVIQSRTTCPVVALLAMGALNNRENAPQTWPQVDNWSNPEHQSSGFEFQQAFIKHYVVGFKGTKKKDKIPVLNEPLCFPSRRLRGAEIYQVTGK